MSGQKKDIGLNIGYVSGIEKGTNISIGVYKQSDFFNWGFVADFTSASGIREIDYVEHGLTQTFQGKTRVRFITPKLVANLPLTLSDKNYFYWGLAVGISYGKYIDYDTELDYDTYYSIIYKTWENNGGFHFSSQLGYTGTLNNKLSVVGEFAFSFSTIGEKTIFYYPFSLGFKYNINEIIQHPNP